MFWLALWATTGGPGVRMVGIGQRLPAMAIAALEYVRLLLLPIGLHLERFTAVPGWSIQVVLAAWAALFVLGVGSYRVARGLAGGVFLLSLATLLYLPGSGVVPVYPAVADRALFTPEHFLYLPLLGLTPLVAGAWPRPLARAAPAVLAVVLVAWGVVVVDRNRDWRDEETLFRHTIAYQPPTGRVWFNLGNLAVATGRRRGGAALRRCPGPRPAGRRGAPEPRDRAPAAGTARRGGGAVSAGDRRRPHGSARRTGGSRRCSPRGDRWPRRHGCSTRSAGDEDQSLLWQYLQMPSPLPKPTTGGSFPGSPSA